MPVEALDHVQLAMPPHGEDAARRFYAGLHCLIVLTLSRQAHEDR